MKIIKLLIALGYFAMPIFRLIFQNSAMGIKDYVIAGLFLILQWLISYYIFKLTPRWSVYFTERWGQNQAVVEVASDLFYSLMTILFFYIIPFRFYLHLTIPKTDILISIIFCSFVLERRIIFTPEFGRNKVKYLPYLSLTGLLFTLFSSSNFDLTKVTITLWVVFCLEISLSFAIQVFRKNSINIKKGQ